jgi:predicted methyltransferase
MRPAARLALAFAVALTAAHARAAPSEAVARAVADPSRPVEDASRDPARKPAETLEFVGVKPGDVVADYLANGGYFSRLFSEAVGPQGAVYAVELNEVVGKFKSAAPGYAGLKATAAWRKNITVMTQGAGQPLAFPRPLDVFWIAQNYHDLHDKFLGPVDVAAFNRQVFAALKPGGVYVILDHRAAKGAPGDVTETLHRIDPERVKREVEAAGFRFVAESDVLANPADPLTVEVFDPKVRGRTDQFILKFRKPG